MIKSIFVQCEANSKPCLADVDFSLNTFFAIEFTEMEDAQAFASQFPKYCKARVTTCHHVGRDSEGNNINYVSPEVLLDTTIKTDERTGEANETAIKRAAKIRNVIQNIMAA